MAQPTPKIAIAHEWFVNYAGSERVVEQMLLVTPEAKLHALVDFLKAEERGYLGGRKANTSFIQNLPFAKNHFRKYLPLFPAAIEGFDFRNFDIVLSSSHAVAKGVLTNADQLHISYCHSPMRYAWDLYHQYLEEANLKIGLKGFLAQRMLSKLRLWDFASAHRVNKFVANSKFIAKRIKNAYGREADVIYPPVDVDKFSLSERKEDYFLCAARFVPYKKVDLIVEAFSTLTDKKLIVVGNGTEEKKIKALANPKNTEILNHVSQAELIRLMQGAKAFLFAAEEDFGITLVEAQSAGTPVIAFGKGGAAEIVINNSTGVLFKEQTPHSVREAVNQFETLQGNISPINCSNNSQRFSAERFRNQWAEYVKNEWEKFQANS